MADRPRTIQSVPASKQPRNPISRRQVEKVMSRSVAGFGLVFGAQAIPWLLGQLDEAYPLWLWVVVPVLFGMLPLVLVSAILQIWVKQTQSVYAVLYLAALISWPFAVLPGVQVFTGIHWLNYLITIGTAMAAIGFSRVWATVYVFLAPTIYLVIRVTPQGGGAPWALGVLEAVYALILGGAIMIIITMLRAAASSVDRAQSAALARYGHAVQQHATEVERVQVDSIVHDSVLTTFLSAARAFTPDAKQLAATMAGNAIEHLREAALVWPDDGKMVRLSLVSDRIVAASSQQPGHFAVRLGSIGTRSIPAQAAEAVVSAAVQSMVNSQQHAGPVEIERWIAIRALKPDGVEVVVGDAGSGFSVAELTGERIGIRVSIIERVASAGGRVVITSAPGEGTEVKISWPSDTSDGPAEARAEQLATRGAKG